MVEGEGVVADLGVPISGIETDAERVRLGMASTSEGPTCVWRNWERAVVIEVRKEKRLRHFSERVQREKGEGGY